MANGPVNVIGSPETSANILDIPYAAATLIYTGVKQSPAWVNYDAAKLEISGELYGIEARAYTVNFTPKAGYIWCDGTQGTKSVVWLINNPQVTVSMETKGDATVTVKLASGALI